jgi:secondary thiamine-phosphate synthase enzyme
VKGKQEMKIMSRNVKISTQGMTDIVNITDELAAILEESGMREGSMTVFCPGSTGGITTIEFEPGLLRDLPEFLEQLIPMKKSYHHDRTWGDANGYAHLRSALIKTGLTIPFLNGALTLGTWQQVVLLDFDNRPRERHLVVQLIGE